MPCKVPHTGFRTLTIILLVPLVAVLWAALNPQASIWAPRSDFMLGGIQVNEPDHDEWVNTLDRVGMNTVAITVYAKQGNWDSDHFWYDGTEPGLINEIRVAKEQGLKVALVIRVALDHAYERNKFLWHGMIMPKTDAQLKSWFKQYGDFVLEIARMAQKEGVDFLSIGNELRVLTATTPVDDLPPLEEYYLSPRKQKEYKKSLLRFKDEIKAKDLWVRGFDNYTSLEEYLENRVAINRAWARQVTFEGQKDQIELINQRRALLEANWRNLIRGVRECYGGMLSYSANFDNYSQIGFWDELDAMGINAYFQLRELDSTAIGDTSFVEMKDSWREILSEVDDLRQEIDCDSMPVVFTELGYIYRQNCTVAPWAGFGFTPAGKRGCERLLIWSEQPESFIERALAVRALRQASVEYGSPLLSGILYWKLTTKDYHVPVEPFALLIGQEKPDPLQKELLRFLSLNYD